jgi:hypothetical protein
MTYHVIFADATLHGVRYHNGRRDHENVIGGYVRRTMVAEHVDWDADGIGHDERGIEVIATFAERPEDREIEVLRDELGATAVCVRAAS